jgi:hypothetical protein
MPLIGVHPYPREDCRPLDQAFRTSKQTNAFTPEPLSPFSVFYLNDANLNLANFLPILLTHFLGSKKLLNAVFRHLFRTHFYQEPKERPVLTRELESERYLARANPKRGSRFRQYFKQAIITLVSFVVAASLLNQIIPSPLIPPNLVFISPKYQYYQTHKDEYNALFFGSSRIYSQIDPILFDKSVQKSGETIKSYNFGIPALRALPGYVLLRDVLKNPPKNLKWVFIETPLDRGYEPIQNARTNRAIYWHTPENTRLAISYILHSNGSVLDKAALISSHLLPFMYHQMNIGRLFAQWLPIHQFSAEEESVSDIFLAKQGLFPLTDETAPERQAFLAHLGRYEQAVEESAQRKQQNPYRVAYLEPGKLTLLQKLVAAVEATGAQPIFVIPPTLEPQFELKRAHNLGHIPTLLAFNDPAEHPDLYALEQRYDEEHLNAKGTALFTQKLAASFSTLITPAKTLAP